LISPKNQIDWHFAEERGAITALSSVFLAMAAAFAWAAFYLSKQTNFINRFMWFLLSIGFFFLSLDELLSGHERIGRVLNKGVFSKDFRYSFKMGVPKFFRNWNDVIVILYGVFAIIFILLFLQIILRYSMFLEYLLIAFLFYGISTTIDTLVFERTAISTIFEESFKLFSSCFFSIAMFVGLSNFFVRENYLFQSEFPNPLAHDNNTCEELLPRNDCIPESIEPSQLKFND
jgi:hypothetical protein